MEPQFSPVHRGYGWMEAYAFAALLSAAIHLTGSSAQIDIYLIFLGCFGLALIFSM